MNIRTRKTTIRASEDEPLPPGSYDLRLETTTLDVDEPLVGRQKGQQRMRLTQVFRAFEQGRFHIVGRVEVTQEVKADG